MPPGEHDTPRQERRRARLVLAIATLGIAATLLAYGISPGVRHAVGHAAHSVKHAVSNVFDHDKAKGDDKSSATPATSSQRQEQPKSAVPAP